MTLRLLEDDSVVGKKHDIVLGRRQFLKIDLIESSLTLNEKRPTEMGKKRKGHMQTETVTVKERGRDS